MTPVSGGYLTPPVHLSSPWDLDPVPVSGCHTCETAGAERSEALEKGFMGVAAMAAIVISRHPVNHRRTKAE